MSNEKQYIDFAKELFHTYLELRDFNKFITMLDKDITWIGTGKHEICHNFDEALNLIDAEKKSWDGHFKIITQWFEAYEITDDSAVVFGEIKIAEDDNTYSSILIEMNTRLTMQCKKTEQGIKLVHVHFSVPNENQTEDEFVHKSKNYQDNVILEKKLQERTRILKQTTMELEMLIANIQGGVQLCERNDKLTNIYVNDGYYELIGYTKEEFSQKFSESHMAIIPEEWREKVIQAIDTALTSNNNVLVEYPIIHKSGKLVWVLDRGTLITDTFGNERFQCVLIDITAQEDALNKVEGLKNYYESILNSIPNPLIITNENEEISFLNHTALNVIGGKISLADAVGKKCGDISPKISENGPCPIENLKNGNNITHVTIDNHDYLITVAPLTENGINIGFVEVLQDETIQNMNRKLLMEKNEQLMVSDVRYKIAMEQANICMFEYNGLTKQLIHSDSAMKKFGVPQILENVPYSITKSGIAQSNQEQTLIESYQKIDAGEPVVKHSVTLYDTNGNETIQEVTLTNIYNDKGESIRAIGVMLDVTERVRFEAEKQYREAITSDSLVTYEVNITKNKLINWSDTFYFNDIQCEHMTYTNVVTRAMKKFVHADDREQFAKFTSITNLIEEFNQGNTRITNEHRRLNVNGEYIWVLLTFNIIRDVNSNDLKMFCQIKDISAQKDSEQKAAEEQLFYEVMLSKAATVYEINISKNIIIRGHEKWDEIFGIDNTGSYSDTISLFAHKKICKEDQDNFINTYSIKNILDKFKNGEHEIYMEYRRLNNDDNLIWIACTMHILEDPQGDIKAISYVEDINEKKLRELELVFKSERDFISGMFNKGTVQNLIEQYICSDEGKKGSHAFIMFDIDNFKTINDNFGHLFGDAVLSEVSRKVKALFRDNDMLGRIGGDEFAILMKNVEDRQDAIDKAEDIRKAVYETYTLNENKFSISASVGVAFYNEDGNTFDELYKNADIALYVSKKNGKDKVTRYKDTMDNIGYVVGLAPREEFLEHKSFEDNMSEYVFRILHEAKDTEIAINSVLELVGKHYNYSRVYIFEDSHNGLTTSNTFEWCNRGIPSRKEQLGMIKYTSLDNYKELFNSFGILLLSDQAVIPDKIKQLLFIDNLKSTVQFELMNDGKVIGFIGFDEYDETREHTKNEITCLKGIADLLAVFLVDIRTNEKNKFSNEMTNMIFNKLSCYAYVIDMDNYSVKYANDEICNKHPNVYSGAPCYMALHERDEPCQNCYIKNIKIGEEKECSFQVFHSGFQREVNVFATQIDWKNSNCCLITVFN